MSVDKNLFLHNFAVVTVVKGESSHLKEWLDYHLLAGVDHFFIYDNEIADASKKILQPYIDAGFVTCVLFLGKNKKLEAYNDAVKNFKFECRYIAFLDVDEFILPKTNQSIAEVTEEILSGNDKLGGMELNSFSYNAGNLAENPEGALLDNFTRRGRRPAEITNIIANPRRIDFLFNTRYAIYFDGALRLNEYSGKVIGEDKAVLSEKIIVNNYKPKVEKKDANPQDAVQKLNRFIMGSFYRSNIFDDAIVNYRDERKATLGDDIFKAVPPHYVDDEKLLTTLAKTLLPAFNADNATEFFKVQENQLNYFRAIANYYITAPDEFFQDKLETFLTCLNVATYLKQNLLGETVGKLFEDATLNAICQTLCTEIKPVDANLLIRQLPQILAMPYKTVEVLISICAGMLDKMKAALQSSADEEKISAIDDGEMALWKKFVELDGLEKTLKAFIGKY